MLYVNLGALKVVTNEGYYKIFHCDGKGYILVKIHKNGEKEVRTPNIKEDPFNPYNPVYQILDLLKGSFITINHNDLQTLLYYAAEHSPILKEFLSCNDKDLCTQEILFNFRKFAC